MGTTTSSRLLPKDALALSVLTRLHATHSDARTLGNVNLHGSHVLANACCLKDKSTMSGKYALKAVRPAYGLE